MVTHEILVQGVGIDTVNQRLIEQKCPVLLQMHDDDFPARFLQDLVSSARNPISSATLVNPALQPLLQPVQRMVNLALVELNCNSLSFPRLDPTRVETAGVVIRRVYRHNGKNGGNAWDDPGKVQAWMKSPSGQFQWCTLNPEQECWDPEPSKRRQLHSGQPELDRQLAALTLATANTEGCTPAFVAPPDTCKTLDKTIVYAVIPTASSEVCDASPPGVANPAIPSYDRQALAASLPTPLQSGSHSAPASGQSVDCHWMSDDFLQSQFPGNSDFQIFSTALRMLHTVFGAFDGTAEGQAILQTLNAHNVTFGQQPNTTSQPMGDFYSNAKSTLLDYNGYGSSSPAPAITMPSAWDGFSDQDEDELLSALLVALGPKAKKTLTPLGRFQDPTRLYRLRMFFRIKGETPTCPSELVWSDYSEPFRIAAWYESGDRAFPPVPLPNPNKDFLKNAKPNCSFQVPGALMGAMQGASMSGLMGGSGGGSALSLDWICGFNIPLITICAFFVLSIFLALLNIVFFWLPFVKICIPFPMPSAAAGDGD